MDLFTTHVVSAVGITLVHFIWQGAAIGLITAAVLATCPRAMARTRYGIAGAGLAAMTMAPLVTLGLVWQTAPAITAGLPTFTMSSTTAATGTGSLAAPAALIPWLPAAVAMWALGVIVLTGRLVTAWVRTERVRHRDVRPVSDGLVAAVRRLARDLGLRRAVALFESPWIDTPTVIGWIRPTILLPMGALTGLSVQQIEAVLSHELAHIKRHDYLVNVLQNLAETIFFYHPAVWWLSRQIRIEREHCCDDVAVEACGNPVAYARALATLEESRQRQAVFALAVTDGSLVDRVRRLVARPPVDRREPSLPIAVCVAVILAVITISGAHARAQAEATTPVAEAMEVRPTRGVLPPGTTVTLREADGGAVVVQRELTRDEPRVLAVQVPPGAPAPPAPPLPPSPIRVGGDIREPRKILDVRPVYPEPARAAGIRGVVILEATIDTEGLPVNIKVLRSIPDLDQAAINAVRQWRYEPTLLNGVPVAVMMTVTVNFTLQTPAEDYASLERRYAALSHERDLLQGTPDQLDARRRSLELLRVRLEQQLEAARVAAGSPAVRVGGDIREPRKIHDVAPVYPGIARAAKVSGVVILEILIDVQGNVTDVRVLRSIPMLDSAAIEAVRQWRYEPVRLNGAPTAVLMTVTVNFAPN